MLELAQDPSLADKQMRAVIFYLTTFGHISGAALHPFFDQFEHDYAVDPGLMPRQIAADQQAMARTRQVLEQWREKGRGKLSDKCTLGDLQGEGLFLDGHIWACPPKPGRCTEITVQSELPPQPQRRGFAAHDVVLCRRQRQPGPARVFELPQCHAHGPDHDVRRRQVPDHPPGPSNTRPTTIPSATRFSARPRR